MSFHPPLTIENYDPVLNQVFSAREAEKLWGLENGTVRAALNRDVVQGRKSAGTWLVSRRDMEIHYGPQPPVKYQEL
jgi:hypothetical protein